MRLSSPGVPPSSGASTSPLCEAAMPLSYGKRSKSSWRRRVDLIPPANVKAEFYSPYFIVPKKGGRLRPILDLRTLNRALHKLPFKMLMQKRVHPEIGLQRSTWRMLIFMSRFSSDTGHSYGLHLWFERISTRSYPSGCPCRLASSRKSRRQQLFLSENAAFAFSTISTTGWYWHSLGTSCANLGTWCSVTSACWDFRSTGKRANSPLCRRSFLGMKLDSVNQTAWLTEEHFQSVLNCLNSFRGRTAAPLKRFQRLLGHMASAATVTPLGLLHMRPIQHWLHGRVPWWAWQSITHRVFITPFSSWTINCICDNIAIWKNMIS